MSTRYMRLEFSRKAGSGHLALEVMKILVITVGRVVWQETWGTLRCKEQIKEEKVDKRSKLEIFTQLSRHSENQSAR